MAKETELDSRKRPRSIFIFSIVPGGRASVTEVEDNEEGHEKLANIVRVEQILAVVLGEKLSFELESVVTINSGSRKNIVNRQRIDVGLADGSA